MVVVVLTTSVHTSSVSTLAALEKPIPRRGGTPLLLSTWDGVRPVPERQGVSLVLGCFLVLRSAEGQTAASSLEVEEEYAAEQEDEGRPEHAVDDVPARVSLVSNDFVLVVGVVVAEETPR